MVLLALNSVFPAAFSKENLLNGRWLLDGLPANAEGVWHDILKMNDFKQFIFIQRILFMFEITKRKAGKAQILRVSHDVWEFECNMCCCAAETLSAMRVARNDDNIILFEDEKIRTVMNNLIEGYFDLTLLLYFCLFLS